MGSESSPDSSETLVRLLHDLVSKLLLLETILNSDLQLIGCSQSLLSKCCLGMNESELET